MHISVDKNKDDGYEYAPFLVQGWRSITHLFHTVTVLNATPAKRTIPYHFVSVRFRCVLADTENLVNAFTIFIGIS